MLVSRCGASGSTVGLYQQIRDLRAQVKGAGVDENQVLAQLRRYAPQDRGRRLGRHEGQEVFGDVLAQLVAGRRGPSRRVGLAVAAEDPAHLRERVAVFGLGGGDVLLERGPAAHPVLTGDGQLGVVQGGELSRGQPPLRLELAVTQAQTVRQVTEVVVGGSP